ncbi:MAG: hypothetical protein ACRC20_06360 [Segniliparus sp.]|uniref:hypothetical protein n=1 Tax=Segniliparus sp. TaxID=2804064 RepID=UPI003F32EACA
MGQIDKPGKEPVHRGLSWVVGVLLILLLFPVGAYELFIIGLSAMIADGCPSSGPCDMSLVMIADATIAGGWLAAFLVATAGFSWAVYKQRPALRWVGWGWAILILSLVLGYAFGSAGEKAVLNSNRSSAPTTSYTPPYRFKSTLPDEAAAGRACFEFLQQTLDKLPPGWYWSLEAPGGQPAHIPYVVHPETQTSKDFPPLFASKFYLLHEGQLGVKSSDEAKQLSDEITRIWAQFGWTIRHVTSNKPDDPSDGGITNSGIETHLYIEGNERPNILATCDADFQKGHEDPTVVANFPHTITRER